MDYSLDPFVARDQDLIAIISPLLDRVYYAPNYVAAELLVKQLLDDTAAAEHTPPPV